MSNRGRPATGQIRPYMRRDGLVTYSLRVRVNGERYTIRLGTEAQGWSRPRAELELENIQAEIRAGIWTPPRPPGAKSADPTLHEFASLWLKRRIADGIAEKTKQDDLWQLGTHILPFLGAYPLKHITPEIVEAFKEHKLDERARIAAARESGQMLHDDRGRPRRMLSNGSINKLLISLNAILDNAVRRGLIDTNPATTVDRLRTARSKGDILEADELESLIEGAGDLTGRAGSTDIAARFDAVRELRDGQRLSWAAIAKTMGIAESTAIYRYQRAAQPARTGVADPGRRALVATLGCAGLRVSEAAELDLGDIDLAHRKIRVKDAKTEAGVRSVDVTDRLTHELRAYLATRAGDPRAAPAFPTRSGNRRDKDNIRQRVLAPALRRAQELRERRGLPSIGVHVTPHTLRRTYISLMLSAGADIPYVQAQVGHRDPKLTLSIYALVIQRRDRRQFGDAFDRLMRDAIPSMQHANMHPSRPVSEAAEAA
jgi:integrase